ncbi:hypothetical protein BGZ57DRAFT_936334 [Hyaloscypha finlandica]|nr:hypothetical protein BGZ57DRAFT_936334 [Hyaloscypha finlandica]
MLTVELDSPSSWESYIENSNMVFPSLRRLTCKGRRVKCDETRPTRDKHTIQERKCLRLRSTPTPASYLQYCPLLDATMGIQLELQRLSLFPARIPNNNHIYHRTHTPSAVKTVEWLAFEIEHAEMFARAFPERPDERGEGPPPPPFELTWAETVDGIHSMDDDDDEPDF